MIDACLQLDPTGLLSREFIRYAPDPRALHSLLNAQKTKDLLFSLEGEDTPQMQHL